MEKEKDGKKIINVNLDDDSANGDTEEGDVNATNSDNSNLQTENGVAITTKKTFKISKALKDILAAKNHKFMCNFDPELSNREKRKLTRKINAEGKKNGVTNEESATQNNPERDVCDCLTEDCPGCHFPCPKCRSCKCAVECRVNRKWMYDNIRNEVEIIIARNSHNQGS